ncbi:MBL fold metallo-hydrolase [Candidatus Aenigmatarchaeota archaeon]
MKINVLGSGKEVGKSAIVVDDGTKILMDYGVRIHPEPPTYPPRVKVDAAIISHAHLDHSGASPVLTKNKTPIYMTDITMELCNMLLNDSIKVSFKNGFRTPFSKKDVRRMIKNTKLVNYNEVFHKNNLSIELYNAGHIPGSSSILIDGRKSVFYTGDIQTMESHLIDKCHLPKSTDVLIMESTYSYRDHSNRKKEEARLINYVKETMSKNETVLIPAFAVGRSQEIMLILEKFSHLVALDGMAKSASNIISEYARFTKDPKKLRKVLKNVHFVNKKDSKKKIVERYPIIVSTAGMLSGGPAIGYLKEIRKRPESAVLFTGFLVEGTPGRTLTQKPVFSSDNERFKVKCKIERFQLSAHTDHNGLMNIIKKTNPENIICVHGDSCEDFAKSLSSLGFNAHAPKNNQKVIV